MGTFSGKTCRLLSMLSLTASFFLVEIIVGYITNSIALVADSFHMLSDVVALIVGFASVRISKWQTQKNTFGWARAEVLGALVNAVFLVALCFSILVEALKRLVSPEKVEDPQLLLAVGGAGLLVNVIGLFLFHNHGHSHGGGGHGHSHGGGGGHGHSHSKNDNKGESAALVQKSANGGTFPTENPEGENTAETEDVTIVIENPNIDIDNPAVASSSQLNMRGVFLHVLGDALGSVVVVISALVIWFVEGDWKYYLDPCMSIIMVCIILGTTFPLLKESGFILLQTVPSHIKVEEIQKKVEKVEGVLAVHELHIWQLAGNRIIASAHIHCKNLQDYMETAVRVKDFFHHQGIHSTTIQPEFVEHPIDSVDAINSSPMNMNDCVIECAGQDKKCVTDSCCPMRSESKKGPSREGSIRQRQSPGSNASAQKENLPQNSSSQSTQNTDQHTK